jgi:hypothetical protein
MNVGLLTLSPTLDDNTYYLPILTAISFPENGAKAKNRNAEVIFRKGLAIWHGNEFV